MAYYQTHFPSVAVTRLIHADCQSVVDRIADKNSHNSLAARQMYSTTMDTPRRSSRKLQDVTDFLDVATAVLESEIPHTDLAEIHLGSLADQRHHRPSMQPELPDERLVGHIDQIDYMCVRLAKTGAPYFAVLKEPVWCFVVGGRLIV